VTGGGGGALLDAGEVEKGFKGSGPRPRREAGGDPAKAEKRTRSKWSRALRYAAAYKRESEPLCRFVTHRGGINERAARFSRRLGRGGPYSR
jgi:hypothetical protein